MRRKGKVHPSPPPSSSSSSPASSAFPASLPPSTNKDAMSFLKLLPAAILSIVSILSHEDRQVLAYMISRSIKATNPPATSDFVQENSKKNSKKLASTVTSSTHKPPSFDCECFDCYTSYWFRWDSSPNRELIHQAIEAFEEQYLLFNGEQSKKGKNKHKKKDKMGRRGIGKISDFEAGIKSPAFQELGLQSPAFQESGSLEKVSSETAIPQSESTADMVSESRKSVELLNAAVNLNKDVKKPESPEHELVVLREACGGGNNEKGFARKVLPDVLGLFNSRLWNLWGPNV